MNELRSFRSNPVSLALPQIIHQARYTAATVVFLANQVSIENVAKILGHSNTKMTQHYAKVLDSSIMRDMANVENCFANSQNRASAHI